MAERNIEISLHSSKPTKIDTLAELVGYIMEINENTSLKFNWKVRLERDIFTVRSTLMIFIKGNQRSFNSRITRRQT